MRIQCPSCQARANLSEGHEGAKVRCTECGRVYVARPKGNKLAQRNRNQGLLIAGLAGGFALIGLVFLARARLEPPVGQAAAVEVPALEVAPPARLDANSELASEKRAQGYEVVTLSNGSLVFERPPEPLGHLADTPSDLAERIDRCLETMLDLELTQESARAQRELVELGRPALPVLLTRLVELSADTEANRIRRNLIDQALQDITGQHFEPAPGATASAAGTTEERRRRSIRQWFTWWYKSQEKFTTKPTGAALEGLIQVSEEEQRWLERNQDH